MANFLALVIVVGLLVMGTAALIVFAIFMLASLLQLIGSIGE